ncbi:MAG: carboxypeptidase-like regulatory domain-containing protein, partial [Bacteroidaceae bacterium]|nr:carboxypeptidase-like regulatory domain-containing protein [Bacteroidaceae bacterium]
MNAQKIEASGTVIDDMGEPVMMATVVQKGTGNGTTTDMEGHFSLQVEKGATLVISFIGYESVEMPASPNMNITLKDNAKELAEVVVTGYQVQRKADLTGAVAVMDMKGPISESDPNMLN